VVTATGMRTELGKVASMLAGAKEDETPLKTRLREIGRWLSVSYLIICASLFALGVLTGVPLLRMLLWSISLAVAIVPETLPLIITGTLALGVQRMAKRNAIVRKLPAVETLGCITTICSDKTGTLTKNEMTVRRVYAGGKLMEVTGDELSYACEQSEDLRLALQIAALCNDSHLVKEEEADGYSVSGEPTEAALVVAAEEAGMDKDALEKRFPRVGEIPFERERKRMSTVHLVEGRTVAYVKGAPEVLLELSTGIYRGGEVSRLTDAERREVLEISDKMAAEALRVIAVAYRELSDEGDGEQEQYTAEVVERDLVFVGHIVVMQPRVSTAGSFLTIAFRFAILCTPSASVPVIMSGNVSGTIATARLILHRSIRSRGTPVSTPSAKRLAQIIKYETLNHRPISLNRVFSGVSSSFAPASILATLPNSVRIPVAVTTAFPLPYVTVVPE